MTGDYAQLIALPARWARHFDLGEFNRLPELMAPDFTLRASQVESGPDALWAGPAQIVEEMRARVILYGDGTPRTRHVLTNFEVEIGGSGTGRCQCYLTLHQVAEDGRIGIIALGHYRHRFAKIEGRWLFTERNLSLDYIADFSRHIRPVL